MAADAYVPCLITREGVKHSSPCTCGGRWAIEPPIAAAGPDLPAWVFDAIMAMQKWSDEHPASKPGDTACGCEGLRLVPAEVQSQARVLASYLAKSTPVDKPPASP